jgi:hypothetical protein
MDRLNLKREYHGIMVKKSYSYELRVGFISFSNPEGMILL